MQIASSHTPTERLVLLTLSQATAPMTMPDIARATGAKRNTLNITLKRLVLLGYVLPVSPGYPAHCTYTLPTEEEREALVATRTQEAAVQLNAEILAAIREERG